MTEVFRRVRDGYSCGYRRRSPQAASRYSSPAFIADVTIRHPEDDNAELLWHCGPFAKSLVKKGVIPAVKECKGMYEIEGGPLTVVRFDQDDGNYLLLADEERVLMVRRLQETTCGLK